MPKLVDPEERRRVVVDALFRVVVREGLQRASLRTVADEAGLNIGSLRHYFAGQAELMDFAMRSMIDRVSGRLVQRIEDGGELRECTAAEQLRFVTGLMEELLPLDDRRRAEVTVFLDFNAAARTNPAFRDRAYKAADGTRKLIRRALALLDDGGALRAGLDLDVESERLASLVDGLCLNAVLHPDVLDAPSCTRVLHAHMHSLADLP